MLTDIGFMKLIYILLIMLFIASCTQREDNVMDKIEIEKEGVKFYEIDYGIGYVEHPQTLADSLDPTGKSIKGNAFFVTNRTDTIPASIGTEFGIRYNVTAETPNKLQLTKIWVFPQTLNNPMTHKQYDRLIRQIWASQTLTKYFTYRLDDSFELVKGDWKLLIYYKRHLLFSRHFYVK
jgi:hypothetical protein